MYALWHNVTTTVTWVHPNSTPGVWAYHFYNWWNRTSVEATSMAVHLEGNM
jgi:hypothetical protein